MLNIIDRFFGVFVGFALIVLVVYAVLKVVS